MKSFSKVRVHLENRQTKDIFCFDIIPHQTGIAKKWVKALGDVLDQKLEIEKNFCWVGFPDTPRQLPSLCEQLNGYIDQINRFSESGLWKAPYHISERFSRETIVVNQQLNHDLMNRIHHHFEVLQGQVWNISPWFIEANNDTRFAIKQLNNLCHEIEILVNAKRMQAFNPEKVSPATLVSFINSPRFDLEPEDYDHFTLERGFGKVYMHYCQTGKIHWEAFRDADEQINSNNINGLRYFSGEFNIDWGPNHSDEDPKWKSTKENYKKWLIEHGYNPDDKFLSHGWLEIGHIDTSAFSHLIDNKNSTIHQFLSAYLNIVKIEIYSEGQIQSHTYTNNWTDEGYLYHQQREFEKSYS